MWVEGKTKPATAADSGVDRSTGFELAASPDGRPDCSLISRTSCTSSRPFSGRSKSHSNFYHQSGDMCHQLLGDPSTRRSVRHARGKPNCCYFSVWCVVPARAGRPASRIGSLALALSFSLSLQAIVSKSQSPDPNTSEISDNHATKLCLRFRV